MRFAIPSYCLAVTIACDAMIAGKFQSSPKLEKFKPLISFVEEHLNMMGSLEKES